MKKRFGLLLTAAGAAMAFGWLLKKKRWAGKAAKAVTVISGSDGPTSIFLAGKFSAQSHKP